MTDTVAEQPQSQALSTELAEMFPGKEIGGHPFFEANLPKLIKSEAQHENPKASAQQIDQIVQDQLSVGGYDKVVVPSYNDNNGVYILIEPEESSEEMPNLQSQTEDVIDVGETPNQIVPSNERPDTKPHTGGYKAFITAFPSEQEFQALRAKNPDLARFGSLSEYRQHITSLFALPAGARYNLFEDEGRYERASLYVPFSQHYLAESEDKNILRVQTPLSAMIDKMIQKLSVSS